MGYSCTIEQEREAIQSLTDNGFDVDKYSIQAYLENDIFFFQEITDSENRQEDQEEDFEFDLSGWD